MKQPQLVHPHSDRLTAFGSGQLDREGMDEVARHVSACDMCRQQLEALPDDTLVSLLRGATVAADSAGQKEPETPGSADATAAFPPGDNNTSAATSSPPPSDTLALPLPLLQHPRYHILDLLGAGGMGAVYRARHRMMDRAVALKVINGRLVDRPGMVERFHREVKAAAQLSHPNIVTAHDAEQAGDTHFLVMELVDGQSLDRLVQERGPLPVAEACDYIRQAALGLQHAFERGMVHRDIKPHNLMRTPDGRVKVLDFGLAHFVSEALPSPALTDVGTVMGTPDYIAPEQARDSHSADTRADIYSLGCTLYFLLTGQPPFPEGTYVQKLAAHLERMPRRLDQLRSDLPPGLARVVEQMLAKDPAQRYQRPAEVAAALAPFAVSSAAHRPPRRLSPWWAAAVLLVGLLGAGGYWAAPSIYRIATNRGELVIETDDPEVEVIVRKGGADVRIVDPASGQEITLQAGAYQLELKKGKEKGLSLSTDHFTLERGGRQIVKVQMLPPDSRRQADATTLGVKPARVVIPPEPLPERKPGSPLSPYTLVSQPATLEGVRSWTVETVGERNKISAVSHVPGSALLACASDDGQIRLWDLHTGRLVRVLVGAYGRLATLACSPDGKTLACGGWEGVVQLWNVETGRLLRTLRRQETGATLSLAWSPDGRTLAVGCGDNTLWLWDPLSSSVRDRLRGHVGPVLAVAWSSDGKALASGSADKTVRLWDARSGEARQTLQRHSGPVQAVAWSPDGKKLASGSEDATVRLWEAGSGSLLQTLERKTHSITSVAWSPDGKTLACGGNAILFVWAAGADEKPRLLEGPPQHIISSVSWSADGKTLASGGWDKSVRVWDIASGEAVRTLSGSDIHFQHRLAWSPDATRLAVGSRVTPLTLYDVQTGQAVRTFPGFAGDALAWSPDGRTVASTPPGEKEVRLWEAGSGKLLRRLQGHTDSLFSLAWSPDGKTLASGSDDGSVRLWEAASGELLRTLTVQPPGDWGVQALAWSPDGKVLATGGKEVRLWEASSGKSLQSLGGQPQTVLSLAWSSDGKTLAVGSGNNVSHWEGQLKLWSPRTGQKVSLLQDGGAVHALVWSPDGKTLVTGGGWGDLRVWETGSGRLLRELPGHVAPLLGLSRSADGALASADESVTIRFWDASTGKPKGVLVTLPKEQSLAVSPDGHYSASPGVEEQIVYVIETEQGQETITPADFVRRSGWKNDPRRVRLTGK